MSQFNRRDVFVAPDDTFHEACANESGLTLDGQLIPDLPPLVHVRGVVDDIGQRWLIVSGDAPEAILLREGAVINRFRGPYGVGFSALNWTRFGGVEVYLSGPNVNDRAEVWVGDALGRQVETFDVPYMAGGILYVADLSRPVMDGEPITRRTINGVDLFQVTECKGHLVGLADGGDTPGGAVVWVPPSGVMRMHQVPRGVQLAPRIAVNSSGEARIVYSGHDSPDMEAMTWEPYRRFVPPPVVLPTPHIISGLSLPAIGALPPAWFGFWFNVSGRGGIAPGNMTCSLSSTEDTRPFIGQLSRWPEEYAGRRVVGGYLGSEYDEAEYFAWLDKEIAECKARHVPIHLFCDSVTHTERVKAAAVTCRAAGLETRPLVHVRWTETTRPYRDVLREWSADLGARGCVFAYHFQWTGRDYALSKEQFSEQMAALFTLWREQSWQAVLGFSWDRVGSVAHCPELIPFAELITVSTMEPKPAPPPPVVEKPTGLNNPTGTTTKPKRGGKQEEKPDRFGGWKKGLK